MPNATLCGKAVVEMVLAQISGVRVTDVQTQLVAEGDLPIAYLITDARIERCKDMDEVRVQDEKGVAGIRSIDKVVQAQRDARL